MAKKYYAVRKGRHPGITTNWAECQVSVVGYAGAEYKSFNTEEEAKEYLAEESPSFISLNLGELSAYAFVDGSFNEETTVYGWGGFIIDQREEEAVKYIIQGNGNDEEMATMRNVAGEISGSMAAIKKAIELEMKELTILYDYAGIEQWATGNWKRNKEGTKAYYEYCQSVKDDIKLIFVKVEGHTGIPGNEEADQLAKEAAGIN